MKEHASEDGRHHEGHQAEAGFDATIINTRTNTPINNSQQTNTPNNS